MECTSLRFESLPQAAEEGYVKTVRNIMAGVVVILTVVGLVVFRQGWWVFLTLLVVTGAFLVSSYLDDEANALSPLAMTAGQGKDYNVFVFANRGHDVCSPGFAWELVGSDWGHVVAICDLSGGFLYYQ